MKRSLIISKTLVIIFLALFAYYFIKHTQDFKSLQELNLLLLIAVVLGYVGSIYLSGLFSKIIIEPFNKRISHIESFRVALLSSIGNYFGPLLGGTGMRAVYLKKKVGLSYTDFVSTLYGYYIIAFLISAVLGVISLALLHEQHQKRGFLIVGAFFVSVATGLLGMIFNRRVALVRYICRKLLGKRVDSLKRLATSWHKISTEPKLIASLVKITFMNIGLFAAVNYCEFLLIGIKLDIGVLLLYTCLGIFSILISLTPAALGIREAVYLFSASVLGVTSSQILAVALIDRTVQFIVMASGWVITSVASQWFKQDLNKD